MRVKGLGKQNLTLHCFGITYICDLWLMERWGHAMYVT